MWKKILVGCGLIVALLSGVVASGVVWSSKFNLSEAELSHLRATTASQIDYLQSIPDKSRGKILAVVTSVEKLGDTGKITGYELTELSRAYWVFLVNGFDVDVASPQGGEPYALLDAEDMGPFDYAFLNDAHAQQKIKNTLKLDKVTAADYEAIYFVGGKGAMFDFPDNPEVHRLVKEFEQQDKVIAAVCHGPAALVNAKSADGKWLVANKKVSAFTNTEELLLIPNAETIFPFLLQTRLEQRGAHFIAGPDYLNRISVDGKLVTGQNPWSVWSLAEAVIQQLGYEPSPRELTPEERSVKLLTIFQDKGLDHAENIAKHSGDEYNGWLVLMHAMVAFMKAEPLNGVALMMLADEVRPRT